MSKINFFKQQLASTNGRPKLCLILVTILLALDLCHALLSTQKHDTRTTTTTRATSQVKISETPRSHDEEATGNSRVVRRDVAAAAADTTELDANNQPAEATSDETDIGEPDAEANYESGSTSGTEESSSSFTPDYAGDVDSPAVIDPQPTSHRQQQQKQQQQQHRHQPHLHSAAPQATMTRGQIEAAANLRPSRQSDPSSSTLTSDHLNQHISSSSSSPITTPRTPLKTQSRSTSSAAPITTTTGIGAIVERPAVGSAVVAPLRNGLSSARQTIGQQQQSTSLPPPVLVSNRVQHDLSVQTTRSPTQLFNVNMGADPLLIKPHHQYHHQQPPVAQTTTTRSNNINLDNQEITTTESANIFNHELLSESSGSIATITPPINERRQDLLYPSATLDEQANSSGGGSSRHSSSQSFTPRTNNNVEQQDTQSQVPVPSICYTPIALLMVILVTMMITIVVCFCTHVLIRHLGRHQFDLIENSKHFVGSGGSGSKHGSGYLQGAAGERRTTMSSGGASSSATTIYPPSGGHHADHLTGAAGKQNSACALNLFQQDDHHHNHFAGENLHHQTNKGANLTHKLRDEPVGCAFDNPYFREELVNGQGSYSAGGCQQQPIGGINAAGETLVSATHAEQKQPLNGTGGLLATTNHQGANFRNNHEVPASEQLHFIEHHISNLHNRQVTSSVKELSILGSPDTGGPIQQQVAHVVDLTSEKQRAKVIANPREGDLVAVDLIGHDFIGLGFDVCGNSHDGIFIRSVLSRGPARESGCIHTGDRIKCLNISFDNITLQDACDILNSGSPYKMRLLLEKRAAPVKLTDKLMRSREPPMLRPSPRSTTLSHQHLLVPDDRDLRPSSGGPISATKNCIKRLTNLVSPNSSSNNNNKCSTLSSYPRNRFSCPQTPITTTALNLSEHHLLEPAAYYLGSAAARRHLQSGDSGDVFDAGQVGSVNSNAAHVNAGYGSDGDGDDDTKLRMTAAEEELARRNHQQGTTISHYGDGGSRGDDGRFSADSGDQQHHHNNSHDIFSGSSTTNDFGGNDSSLDCHNRNANHRLHGPPIYDDQYLNHHHTQPQRNNVDGGAKLASIGARRQSVDVVGGDGGAIALKKKDHNRQMLDQVHLEQTQSQPEIAVRRGNHGSVGEVLEELELAANVGSNSRGGAAGVEGDVDLLSRNGRSHNLLMNSMSTPTMNLLTNQPAEWQVSSRRRKKQERGQNPERSNRGEERAGSDNNSFADSASQLAEGRIESKSTGGATSTTRNTQSGGDPSSSLAGLRSTGAYIISSPSAAAATTTGSNGAIVDASAAMKVTTAVVENNKDANLDSRRKSSLTTTTSQRVESSSSSDNHDHDQVLHTMPGGV